MIQQNSAAYCSQIIKDNDSDRFLISQFVPLDVRTKLFAIYALNYELSRIWENVNEPMAGMIRFQWWREAIDKVYAGEKTPGHPVLELLFDVIHQSNIPKPLFDALIEGRQQDIQPGAVQSMDELKGYCDATSGKLFQIAGHIYDYEDIENLNWLGQAWGMLHVLLAVPGATQKQFLLPTGDADISQKILDRPKTYESEVIRIMQGVATETEQVLEKISTAAKNPILLYLTYIKLYLPNLQRALDKQTLSIRLPSRFKVVRSLIGASWLKRY